MIIANTSAYARVWQVYPRQKDEQGQERKFFDMTISTSEKSQNDEEKITYSNWYVRVVGHAFNSLKDVKDGDNIQIKKFKITNERYTAKDGSTKSAFRFVILEAEISNFNGGQKEQAQSPAPQQQTTTTPSEDEVPW